MAREQGIDRLIDRFHSKDAWDAAGRYVTAEIQDGLKDIVFVDDRPEDLPIGAAVVAVPPYLSQDRHDRGLMRAGWSGPKVPSGSEGEVLDQGDQVERTVALDGVARSVDDLDPQAG